MGSEVADIEDLVARSWFLSSFDRPCLQGYLRWEPRLPTLLWI